MKRRKIVVMAIAIMVLTLGITKAFFTDTAVSRGNTITTGEFDLAVSKDGKRFYNELKLFDLSNMVPGDKRNVTFQIKNRGTVNINRLTMTLKVRDYEIKMSSAEKNVDSTPDVGELGKWLILREVRVNGKVIIVNQTLDELNGKTIALPVILKPGTTATIKMTFELPAKAGNECQTDGVDLSLRIDASQ